MTVVALSATTSWAQDLGGRWSGYRDVHHRNDCRLAHQVLTHGQPAVKRDWALAIIHGCGPLGGEALAHLLRKHRFDTERGPELEEIVTNTTRFTDRSIYEAAMEIAQEPTAGEVARIQALRALFNQLTPGNFAPYESFVTDSLVPAGISTYHTYTATPLPEDAYEKIHEAMSMIRASKATPEPVRRAAMIVAVAARNPFGRH
jgi:hypothetical protein